MSQNGQTDSKICSMQYLLQDVWGSKSDHFEVLCIKGLITDLNMYLPAGAIYKDKNWFQ